MTSESSLVTNTSLKAGIMQRLLKRKDGRIQQVQPNLSMMENIRVLPPFESQIAILKAHIGKWKLISFVSIALTFASVITSAMLLRHRLFEKMNSEFIIVPGAFEFTRVRPNLISDSIVKDFAQFVATYAGNFTYRNAKDHFETVAERMVPALKGRYLRDAEAKFSEWNKRRVDQVFAFDPFEIHVANDKFGSKYVLVVEGRRSQYADGTMLQETDENLYLELRPRLELKPGNRSDESLLHVERLEWVSRSQAESLLAPYIKIESAKAHEK